MHDTLSVRLQRNRLLLVVTAFCAAVGMSLVSASELVVGGEARAVLVIADKANKVASYAAEEFAEHLRLATGVRLDIVPESAIRADDRTRVFIGETMAARKLGIRAEELLPDEYILRTVDSDIYVLGLEDPQRDRLLCRGRLDGVLYYGISDHRPTSPNGTLFGIYELLHRYAGVRWLWPGELGTYIPRATDIVIAETLNERCPPQFKFRRFNWHHISRYVGRTWALDGLGFSASAVHAHRRANAVYFARHRHGYSGEDVPRVGHTFSDWWSQHGAEHPEWFMMHEDGRRGYVQGVSRSTRHIAMCVSNPDLHRYIVEEFWDGGNLLRLGEVDGHVCCLCEKCLDWDEPQPETGSYPESEKFYYEPRMLSNRYTRFWKTIRDMAVAKNPDVLVTSYLYYSYFPSPTHAIELNRNIFGMFTPWGGKASNYPMPAAVDQWLRAQWAGWAATGIQMVYRPNHFHSGYVMPHFSTRQAGEFFKYTAANGSLGFQFDSLFGHWATKGLMYYVYMRLSWEPELEIETIRREYFAAFGPAAEHVARYFDDWEEYSRGISVSSMGIVDAAAQFSPEALARGAATLRRALDAARTEPLPEYAARVRFLQAGLEHARLSARFLALGTDLPEKPADDPVRVIEAHRALRELVEFRRAHENDFVADISWAAGRENRDINFGLLRDDVVEALRTNATFTDLSDGWLFRQDPEGVGRDEGWHRLVTVGNEWKPIEVPSLWAGTWAGDYLGHGWYRTMFRIPEDTEEHAALTLLFGAVDEQAWIFVNGHLVGEHSVESEQQPVGVLWNQPFSITVAPEHLKRDAENVLVVLVHALISNGGIWQPVQAFFGHAD